jgi:hypothetical protein
MTDDHSKKPWWRTWSFWISAAIVFGYYMNSGRKTPVSDKGATTGAAAAAMSPREIEDAIATQLQRGLQTGFDKNKQELFNAFHPIGTAKNVLVHDVTITGWKHGQVTGR